MPDDVAQNAAPAGPDVGLCPWNVLLIEDDLNIVRQIRQYFEAREIDGRGLKIHDINDWAEAFGVIREHKADLVILDIYRGLAAQGGERIGERVLDDIKRSGFVPVVIYTNLAEGLDGLQNDFVRLVPKTEGLDRLRAEVEALFRTRVPHMHRAILNHLDRALCQYMWGFVTDQWPNLREVANRPEFFRLLLQRLAISFDREGVDLAISEAFPDYRDSGFDPGKAHPAEFYVKPPITSDPALGDIRLREAGGMKEYLVVLWPTCDMVSTSGREPKTDNVLCARATPLASFPEVQQYVENRSNARRDRLCNLLKNNRSQGSERVHFLPGFLDIPDLVLDFQALENPPLQVVKGLPCLGVIASPFAEQMSSRFDRYRGRIGTPDLDLDYIIQRLMEAAAAVDNPRTDQ